MPQPLEILMRVAQSVRMINSDSIEHSLAQPSQDKRVRVGEHSWVLYPQTYQRIHIKKTPVSEVLLRGTPESKPKILLLENLVQLIGIPVHFRQNGIHRIRDERDICKEPCQ
jgi:hypothetical protein